MKAKSLTIPLLLGSLLTNSLITPISALADTDIVQTNKIENDGQFNDNLEGGSATTNNSSSSLEDITSSESSGLSYASGDNEEVAQAKETFSSSVSSLNLDNTTTPTEEKETTTENSTIETNEQNQSETKSTTSSNIIKSIWGTSPVTFDTDTGILKVGAGIIGDYYSSISGIQKYDVKKIIFEDGVKAPEDSTSLFTARIDGYNVFSTLTKISGKLDTSNVTNMSDMFYQSKVTSLDVSRWDTSSVTDMSRMFYFSDALTSLDVSKWDTSNVTNMKDMFSGCPVTSLDVSRWDTSNVTNMSSLFYNCPVTSLDVSRWDTSNVTNMSSLFYNCPVTSLDVSRWNTSNITDMSSTFANCPVTLLDVSRWNTSNITDMSGTFANCPVTSLDLSNWDTSAKMIMFSTFANSKIKTLKLGEKSLNLYGSELPEIDTSTGEYTGKWVRIDHVSPVVEYDSSTDLINDYDGKAPGTYVWQRNNLITFDTDDGSEVSGQTILSGLTVDQPFAPTKDGYTFKEWQLNGVTYDFSQPVTSDMTLKAVYTKNEEPSKEFGITFDTDGGSAIPSQTIVSGATVTQPSAPTKDGYTFKEWQLDGKTYDFSQPVTSDMTLKAVYTKNEEPSKELDITFDSDGGSAIPSQKVTSGSTVTQPTAPTKDGYTFKEWQLNDVTYDFSQPVTSDLTLKAVYTKNEETKTDKSTPSTKQTEQKKNASNKADALPTTGEKSSLIVIISGILLITIASLWFVIRRQKNNQ